MDFVKFNDFLKMGLSVVFYSSKPDSPDPETSGRDKTCRVSHIVGKFKYNTRFEKKTRVSLVLDIIMRLNLPQLLDL